MSAIIFDLDGTLIDSAPDIHAVANAVLTDAGHDPVTTDQSRSFIGNGVATLVTRMMAAQGIEDTGGTHARLLDDFLRRYQRAYSLTTLYPGAVDALQRLGGAGFKLGLCTNKPYRPALAVLQHFGILALFGAVVGGDSLAQRKPDPAPLLHTAKLLGASHAAFVGDSEVDADCAHRAAMPFALFTEGYRKSPIEALPHDAAFADFADLPALAARLISQTA